MLSLYDSSFLHYILGTTSINDPFNIQFDYEHIGVIFTRAIEDNNNNKM